jgi:hypothetical protein
MACPGPRSRNVRGELFTAFSFHSVFKKAMSAVLSSAANCSAANRSPLTAKGLRKRDPRETLGRQPSPIRHAVRSADARAFPLFLIGATLPTTRLPASVAQVTSAHFSSMWSAPR